MKLLYLTLDAPFDANLVATGNQVRAAGISAALERAGHVVRQLYPAPENISAAGSVNTYRTQDELASIIADGQFDALLVGYWSLLAHLPESPLPVILDFIAPRILELMYQNPAELKQQNDDLVSLLPRADFFLVGNQRQGDILLPLLIQAGFDCRQQLPLALVPISVRDDVLDSRVAEFDVVQLVNAGVDWPWRDMSRYRECLEQLMKENPRIRFVEISGQYPGAGDSGDKGEKNGDLLSYLQMQSLMRQSQIGLEVGERNTEREFSHSFRAMEYLGCGLPVIINAWIPLAADIQAYDAGWVIDQPEQLHDIMHALNADPAILFRKQRGVRKLLVDKLNYDHSCIPFIEYLKAPGKAVKVLESGSSLSGKVSEAPVLKEFVDSQPEQKVSTFKVILGAVFKAVFCPRRPESTPDILMVSRSDLFPTDHGAAVKIIRTAESLSRQGRDVWLVTDNRQEYFQFSAGEMSKHHFPWVIRFFCLPRLVSFVRLLMKGYPVSNSFLYLPVTDMSYIARVIYLTSRKPIGAYQAEFPAYVRPLRYARSLFGGRILLVQHNVEYDRIKNQVPDLTERNYFTLKNIEVAMCHLADNIVAVSDNDREKMIADGIPAEKIHTIPHGVDLQSFRTTPVINIKAHFGLPERYKVLVYHGTYSYPPNLQSMEVMAHEILPRLEARGVQVSVLAIGSKPPDFPLHANIHFTGSVEDLAEVIPAADLAVVPLQDGGGTRMKILDYFAAGVPVISTAKGIEGIPVQHGREALILDDFDAICDAIEDVLNNEEKASALRDAATAFVDSLGWDAVVRRYLPLLQ